MFRLKIYLLSFFGTRYSIYGAIRLLFVGLLLSTFGIKPALPFSACGKSIRSMTSKLPKNSDSYDVVAKVSIDANVGFFYSDVVYTEGNYFDPYMLKVITGNFHT